MATIMKRRRLLTNTLDEGECVALLLTQPRHDAAGNKLQGYTLEEIRAMAPGERTALKAKNPWLATAEGSKEFQKLRQMFARR
ncbi:MAG: hypothetical protein DMG72_20315 [Acidobacteria bacterium]|nr:MAG: hypothetical protein DMG72_20315 [Acidobacteriota bacterium]